LPSSGSVLGDVGDPGLVERQAGELAPDEAVGTRRPLDPLHLGGAGKPGNPGIVHEQCHQPQAHVDAPGSDELGVDPPCAIGAAGVSLDLSNQGHQPLPPHFRRRERTSAIGEVALTRDTENLAAALDGEPGPDEDIDHRVDPFG
jgi:hypothetical protein